MYGGVPLLGRPGLDDRDHDFQVTVFFIIILQSCAVTCLQTADHILRDDRLVFRYSIGILDNRQSGVNDQKPAVVQC